MKKLNLGCGTKYSKDWINIDFNSECEDVITCNLLQPLAFADNSIDVIYSSHLLEHFTKQEGETLIKECFRILKPQGIFRIVVPDLEYTCREYLRILDEIDETESARKQYEWIVIELLDQMVRTEAGGLMQSYWKHILETNDASAMEYVDLRIGVKVNQMLISQKRSLNFNKLKRKLTYIYVNIIKRLIPRYMRQAMVDKTPLGEKHKWMYDRYSLKMVLANTGFTDIRFLNAQTSAIPNFSNYLLDINSDGKTYKPDSLYCEAIKSQKQVNSQLLMLDKSEIAV